MYKYACINSESRKNLLQISIKNPIIIIFFYICIYFLYYMEFIDLNTYICIYLFAQLKLVYMYLCLLAYNSANGMYVCICDVS